jgi:hypothetical protein
MTDDASNSDGFSTHAHRPWLLSFLRYVLPATVVLAGVVIMALGSEAELEGGAGIVSAGLAIYAMSWLYRASVDGDRERDNEQAARVYFQRYGRWPDEKRTAGGATSVARASTQSPRLTAGTGSKRGLPHERTSAAAPYRGVGARSRPNPPAGRH